MQYDAIGSILFVFLVLSLVFEIAMTPIFNSRFFLRKAEGKGIKVPLTLAIALLVFWAYDLDIIQQLLNALGQKTADGNPISPSFGGQIITAFLIAGGSDGVFRIFSKLGIRNPTERKEKAALEKEVLAQKAQKKVEETQKLVDLKTQDLDRAQKEKLDAETALTQANSSGTEEEKAEAGKELKRKINALEKAESEKLKAERILIKEEAKANKANEEQIIAEKATVASL